MKTLIGLLCMAIVIILAACKKDNYELPPETQTGTGTFGCKINGKVWVPNGSDGYSGQNIKATYQLIYPSPEGYVFNFSASNYDNNPIESVSIGSDSLKLYEGMTIKLQSGIRGESGAGRFMQVGYAGTIKYVTGEVLQGALTFTKFDTNNRIASGVFWFDGVNDIGDIVHVTEGRFDVKFTR